MRITQHMHACITGTGPFLEIGEWVSLTLSGEREAHDTLQVHAPVPAHTLE